MKQDIAAAGGKRSDAEGETAALQVFSCGVCSSVTRKMIDRWNLRHPELPARLTRGGSVDLVRQIVAGADCDVVIVADESNIAGLLLPDQVPGYAVFAGNRMVVAANPGYDIDDDNWVDRLLDPAVRFAHRDPWGDPCGYRSVMAMLLADNFRPGLSRRLLEHPGHLGMTRHVVLSELPPYQYEFTYGSGAELSGRRFARLPAVMDQSDPDLAGLYATVHFDCDERTRVVCTPISHALAIPRRSGRRDAAREFADAYLAYDFAGDGFVPRRKLVGTLT